MQYWTIQEGPALLIVQIPRFMTKYSQDNNWTYKYSDIMRLTINNRLYTPIGCLIYTRNPQHWKAAHTNLQYYDRDLKFIMVDDNVKKEIDA